MHDLGNIWFIQTSVVPSVGFRKISIRLSATMIWPSICFMVIGQTERPLCDWSANGSLIKWMVWLICDDDKKGQILSTIHPFNGNSRIRLIGGTYHILDLNFRGYPSKILPFDRCRDWRFSALPKVLGWHWSGCGWVQLSTDLDLGRHWEDNLTAIILPAHVAGSHWPNTFPQPKLMRKRQELGADAKSRTGMGKNIIHTMEIWLVVWNMNFMTFHILVISSSIDELILFRRGCEKPPIRNVFPSFFGGLRDQCGKFPSDVWWR